MSPTTQNELAELIENRAGVYQLLARLWIKEVDEALLLGLRSASFPSLPEAPILDGAYRSLEDYLHETKPETLTELAVDYAVLCRGVDPKKGADPYESVHRSSLGLMMQDEWEEVLRFYREVGLELNSSAIEPEDHLGIELECMARLCQRSLEAFENDDEKAYVDSISMQLHMLEAHLLQWAPRFSDEVLKIAKTDFYRSVATITQEYLQMDYDLLVSMGHR